MNVCIDLFNIFNPKSEITFPMSIKQKLTLLSFLQFFIWGSWLISTGGYLFSLGFKGLEIGSVYSTLGIASLFMPALLGIVADKWMNAERVLGFSHLVGALCLIAVSFVKPTDIGLEFTDNDKIVSISGVAQNFQIGRAHV